MVCINIKNWCKENSYTVYRGEERRGIGICKSKKQLCSNVGLQQLVDIID